MKASTCFTFLFMAIALATVASKSVPEYTGIQIPARLDDEFPTSQARKVVSIEGKELDTTLMKQGGLIGKKHYQNDVNLMKHGGLSAQEHHQGDSSLMKRGGLIGEKRDQVYSNWLKRGGQFSTSLTKPDNAVGEEHNTIDSNLMKRGGINSEEGDETKHYGGGCISVKKCMKKKVICYRKCIDSSGKEVSEDHVPGLHCTVVCKKCVPNC